VPDRRYGNEFAKACYVLCHVTGNVDTQSLLLLLHRRSTRQKGFSAHVCACLSGLCFFLGLGLGNLGPLDAALQDNGLGFKV
jgi:hypothetical protein